MARISVVLRLLVGFLLTGVSASSLMRCRTRTSARVGVRLHYLGLITTSVAAVAVAGIAGGAAAQSSSLGDQLIAYLKHGRIYLTNADGTERRPVLSGVANDSFSWSPDGEWIAFTAGRWTSSGESGMTTIKLARVDGTDVSLLSRHLPRWASEPTWSPDGKRIAFSAPSWANSPDDYANWSIFIINVDGTHLRQLTRADEDDMNPDWSPDGRWIVFERAHLPNSDDPNQDIPPRSKVMTKRPNGTGLHRIATVITGPRCACPAWSPDGSKIAYQSSLTVSTSKYPDVYVMNADGSGQVRLTRHPSRDEDPDWSSDGSKIAFDSERLGNAEIYVMDADGRHLARVTRDPRSSRDPRWRPAP